jgi:type IV pilus assembly protein PilY1
MRSRILSVLQRSLLVLGLVLGFQNPAKAQSLPLSATPLLSIAGAPGLVMLNMSRDHRLYYSAYNDASDLDGDGLIDVGFKPSITYFGYFVSNRCYRYTTTGTDRFVPVAIASASNGCASQATARWHGNWLNWATTSRMDALRRVLYGGFRSTDSTSTTILSASNIPNDSHIWGKEFRPTSVGGPDSYNITHYTPLSTPGAGQMHTFLVKSEGDDATTYTNRQVPRIRFAENVDANIDRVWIWSSSERPIGGANGTFAYTRPAGNLLDGLPNQRSGTAYGSVTYPESSFNARIRVEACVAIAGEREAGCAGYPRSSPTIWKPTGVLHDYAENDNLKFGLLTGSYRNNYSGGVVRKDIGSFSNEVDPATGQFTSVDGIVRTINRLTTFGFNGTSGYDYTCGFNFTSLRTQNQCHMWGAPVAEMMFEGLRYFAGLAPTPAYADNVSSSTSPDTLIGLPLVSSWANPYRPTSSGGSPICSRPVQMVIADPITSFDSDQLPGSPFSIVSGYGAALPSGAGGLNPLKALDVTAEANEIWAKELLAGSGGVPDGTLRSSSRVFFAGQTTTTNSDGNPTPKAATTFATIRGHAPDETNTQGSYLAASVAKYGRETGVRILDGTGKTGVGKVDQISVALGSVIPRIEFSYAGRKVSLVPFSKSVGSNGITQTIGAFQPTGLITLIYIDAIKNTHASNTDASVNGGRPYLRFMASFSDMDQGGDNEADANVYYTLQINASGNLEVQLAAYYEAGSIQQNMGYIISGTTRDGVYLEVADQTDNPIYYLDTRPGQDPAPATGRVPANTVRLGRTATRTFTLGTGSGGEYIPKDPLWYAAKHGGAGVFDSNGDPTNYFKVTNASDLPTQMGKAFRSASALAAVASTSVVGVGQRSLGNAAIYQATFDSLTWTSRVFAFPVDATTGIPSNTPAWEASSLIGMASSRNLWLGRGSGTQQLLPTTWSSLTAAEQNDFGDVNRYNYLLGDKSREQRLGGTYRNRGTTSGSELGSVLGDIVDSDPQIVSQKDFGYGASDSTYGTFVAGINYELLVLGSNDGFLHVFDASITNSTAGKELFGFMPRAARDKVFQLADPDYKHRFFLNGPVALGHAKITVPDEPTVDWRSVIVGTGGTGVQTVFAVNVSSTTFNGNKVMWELDSTTLPTGTPRNAMGNVIGRPVIGKIADGTWVAIFGNGVNSVSDTAKLFVVNLQTGSVISVLDTNNSLTGNGLLSISAIRTNTGAQDTIQYVYGADVKGNVWRFDLSALSSATWTAGAWVYAAPATRPITADILVGELPANASAAGRTGKMIYFGTGRYLTTTDPQDTSVQALYGINDSLTWTSSASPEYSGDGDLVSMSMAFVSGFTDQRVTNGPSTPWWDQSGKRGWVLPLTTGSSTGERVIAPPVRYTRPGVIDALLFTSIIPSADPCNAGVQTWVTAVNPATGLASQVYAGISSNSLNFPGGSPRGVFVLADAVKPTLYISMSSYGSAFSSSSFTTGAGGQQTTCIAGNCTDTRVGSIDLVGGGSGTGGPGSSTSTTNRRQVWRQLK